MYALDITRHSGMGSFPRAIAAAAAALSRSPVYGRGSTVAGGRPELLIWSELDIGLRMLPISESGGRAELGMIVAFQASNQAVLRVLLVSSFPWIGCFCFFNWWCIGYDVVTENVTT